MNSDNTSTSGQMHGKKWVITLLLTLICFSAMGQNTQVRVRGDFKDAQNPDKTFHGLPRFIDKKTSPPQLPKFLSTSFQGESQGTNGIDNAEDDLCPENLAFWADFNGAALVEQLKLIRDYECLRPLFQYDAQISPVLYSNENMALVAAEIEALSANYDGTFESGVFGLMLYLHTTIFHEFSHAEVTSNENTLAAINSAMEAFSANSNIWNLTTEAMQTLLEYLVILDFPGLRHHDWTVSIMKKVLNDLVVEKTWQSIASDGSLMHRYASAYNGVFFYLFRAVVNNDEGVIAILESDEEFIQLLTLVALDEDISNSSLDFMIGNAVLEALRIYGSVDTSYDAESYIVTMAGAFSRLSPNWLRIITALTEGDNCEAHGLCENTEELRAEIELILFPNTWTFDDENLIIRTPLSFSETQELYYASKQVRSQFFRLSGTDSPVQDDPNEALTMIVYGTRLDYEDFQPFLYNLGTNNGGIYIERWATFFTYQRTAQESIFTLEELFRHEYVHYLTGRYVLPGFWGETHFFENNEVTWFDEGLAEFLAGSTDCDGVRIRQSQGNSLTNDSSDRLSVSELLNASYSSGFKFYRYGNALFSYWYANDRSIIKQIINLIRQDDISGYETLINQLKANADLQTSYTGFLDNVFTKPDQWWTPSTSWIDAGQLTLSSTDEVKSEFVEIIGDADITIEQIATNSIARFRLNGILETDDPDGELDALLVQLKSEENSNNFKYLVGYYQEVESAIHYVIQGSLFSCTPTGISYEFNEVCANQVVNGFPQISGVPGGTFSSSEGLSINASTGEIDLLSSTPGDYTITYTTSSNCVGTSTTEISVLAVDDASFNYSSTAFCQGDENPTPTVTGALGGTFSGPPDLVIDANTGQIDLSASIEGVYIVNYATTGACPAFGDFTISIENINTSINLNGDAIVSNEGDATYQWVNCDNDNADIPGQTSQSFTPTESGNYAVVITKNGCVQISDCQSVVITSLPFDTFEDQLNIYPNPSNGKFELDLGPGYANVEVSVRDMHGALVKEPSKYQTQIVAFEFSTPGVYIFQLKSEIDNRRAFVKGVVN